MILYRITGRYVLLPHQLPVPDQAVKHRHIHPHAQLQESPKWRLSEAAAAGLKEELKLMLPKPIAIEKKKNQGTYCHAKDLVPALAVE